MPGPGNRRKRTKGVSMAGRALGSALYPHVPRHRAWAEWPSAPSLKAPKGAAEVRTEGAEGSPHAAVRCAPGCRKGTPAGC